MAIEGIVTIAFLVIISGVVGALPGAGVYVTNELRLANVMQLIIGLIVVGVLFRIRTPMSVVLNQYVATQLKLHEPPERAKHAQSVRAMVSAVVSLGLIILVYLGFVSPWVPLLSTAGIPPWTIGVVFLVAGVYFLFNIYQESKPMISDFSETLAKKMVGPTETDKMSCPQCGAKVPKDSKFCNMCGAEV